MPPPDKNGRPSWMPGYIKGGTYVPPELQGKLDDDGNYTPPEKLFDGDLGARNARVAAPDDSGRTVKKAPEKKAWNPTPAFRVAALIIAGLSSVVSAWFNFGYRASVLPVPIAAVLSLIVVLSATLAPEMVILCWRKKRYVLAALVAGVGVVASVYSMTTTVAGQYNSRAAQAEEAKNMETNELERNRILDEIRRVNVSIDTYQTRITRATDAGKTDASATTLKKQDEARKAGLEAELANLAKTGDPGKAGRKDFYGWIGALLGIPGDVIEFVMSIFPALLLDLAAPIFAVIFLVL